MSRAGIVAAALIALGWAALFADMREPPLTPWAIARCLVEVTCR